jgi:hypothetical protein
MRRLLYSCHLVEARTVSPDAVAQHDAGCEMKPRDAGFTQHRQQRKRPGGQKLPGIITRLTVGKTRSLNLADSAPKSRVKCVLRKDYLWIREPAPFDLVQLFLASNAPLV